jgi:hypothetical protein
MPVIHTKLALSALLATGSLALVGGGVNAAFQTSGSSDEAINAGTLSYDVSDVGGPLGSQFSITKALTVHNTGTLNSQTFFKASDCTALFGSSSYYLQQRTNVKVVQNGTLVYSGSYCQLAAGTDPMTATTAAGKGENGTGDYGTLGRNGIASEATLGRLVPGHLAADGTDTYVFTLTSAGVLPAQAQGGAFTPTFTFSGRDRIADTH